MRSDKNIWYKDWFNSPYYHILYKHRDFEEAEVFVDNLIEYLGPVKGAKVLDLACGKGRHSVYLNKKGLDVTGADLSPDSIDFAKQFENATLHFKLHDKRTPVAVEEFDIVFNLFTSFGYFDNDNDHQKVINAVHSELKNNGVFVLDFLNAKKAVEDLIPEENKVLDNILFRIRRYQDKGYIVKQIDFDDNGKSYSYAEKVRAFTLEELEMLLTNAGLKVENTFGDYHLSPFDHTSSSRLIIISRKT